ncbi:unnamed protein product, partial [Iphiclides podalirius]
MGVRFAVANNRHGSNLARTPSSTALLISIFINKAQYYIAERDPMFTVQTAFLPLRPLFPYTLLPGALWPSRDVPAAKTVGHSWSPYQRATVKSSTLAR